MLYVIYTYPLTPIIHNIYYTNIILLYIINVIRTLWVLGVILPLLGDIFDIIHVYVLPNKMNSTYMIVCFNPI